MKSKFLAIIGVASLLLSNTAESGSVKVETIVLSKDNTLVLNSEVNGESVSKVISKARELDDSFSSSVKSKLKMKQKPLYLFLNTPGGSIQSGLELVEAMKGLDREVHTVTLFAASMGFQIVQNLDDRYILKNGILMSHRARGQFTGEFGGASPSQVDSRYSLWMERVREMDTQTVKRTNGKQTLESYQKQYSSEMWPTGTQSVDQGYADKIVTIKCDSSLTGVSTEHVNFMGFDIAYDLDLCPINTTPMNIRIGNLYAGVSAVSMDSVKVQQEIKTKFLEHFDKNQKSVVPMYW